MPIEITPLDNDSQIKYILGSVAAILLLAFPQVGGVYYQQIVISATFIAIFAVTYDFFSGITGYFSFAHMVFVGLGGYMSAILASTLELSPLLTIPVVGIVTAVVAIVLLGLTSLRLSGLHFVIITIAVAEISLKLVSLFSEVTGGKSGYTSVTPLAPEIMNLVPIGLSESLLEYYTAIGLLIVTTILLLVLVKSKLGTILRLMAQDEVLLRTVGINPVKYRLGAFGISAGLAGFAGATYAHLLGVLTPQTHLSLGIMLDLIIAGIIGGAGTIIGPIIGVGIFFGIEQVLIWLGNNLAIVEQLGIELTEYRRLITMVLVLGFLYFAPEGIYPKLKKAIAGIVPEKYTRLYTTNEMKNMEEE